MSGPLIIGALKIVGGVMAAKSAIEGIKEGNLLKAALGGVGAYMAFSGLGSAAGAAQGGLEQATLEGVGTAAGNSAAENVAQAALEGAGNGLGTVAQGVSGEVASAASGLGSASGVVTDGFLDTVGGAIGDNWLGNGISALNDNGNLLGKGGLLDFASTGDGSVLGDGGLLGSDYAKGQAISGALNFGGQYMQGQAMQDKAEWELDQQKRMYEEQRRRRAAIGDMSFMNDLEWNAQTGKFEKMA